MQFQPSDIKLIVGLGNVGKEYVRTRHNVGFMFVDMLTDQWQTDTALHAELSKIEVSNQKVILAKPTTFMNLSGSAVAAVSHYFKIEPQQILVVHDDLDIVLGEYKIHLGKGPKVHNGLGSIDQTIGANYWRLRMGIEDREQAGNKSIPGASYALANFTVDQMKTLQSACIQAKEELGLA